MQSQNCTVNPLFCTANQAIIAACDFSLFLGSGTVDAVYVEKNASDPSDPGHNVTVQAQFNGRKILAASLKRLAPLGLSNATDIILCGVTFGGTALILNADYIGTRLKALAPKLVRYKAVAVDANHPQYGTGLAMSRNVHRPAQASEDPGHERVQSPSSRTPGQSACGRGRAPGSSEPAYTRTSPRVC